MIRLSQSGKLLYAMLSWIILLLVLYAILMLLSASQTLSILTFLPPSIVEKLASQTLHLTLVTGLITGGLLMCEVETRQIRYWLRFWIGWRLWIGLSLGLSGFEFGIFLDGITAMFLFGYLGIVVYTTQAISPFLKVWRVGVVLLVASLIVPLFVSDRFQDVVGLFRVYVTYPIVGVSISFYLMPCWSRVRREWAYDGVVIVSTLLGIGGVFMSLAPIGLSPLLRLIAGFGIPIAYMILGGHSYRALRDRTHNMSLSPHWVAIAVLLWLAGGGFLGTLSILSSSWQGTPLINTQISLMRWGILAILLSLVNYTATSLRGDNRRVTGYMPLWLIAFGIGFANIIQGCIGVVEIYLMNILAYDTTTIPQLLIPLRVIRLVCLMGVAIGVGIYALGFWVRRPRIV